MLIRPRVPHPAKFLFRCGVAFVMVVFAGFVFSTAPAIAAPLEKTPDVKLPQPPSVPVPAPAPAPALPEVKVPDPPIRVPVDPPVKVPDVVKSTPSSSSPAAPNRSGSATDVTSPGSGPASSIRGGVDRVKDAADSVTSAAGRATHQGDAPGRESPGANTDRLDTDGVARGTSRRDAPSVRRAVTAPLQRLLAYVWPAIALGPIREALAIPLARGLKSLEKAISLPILGLDRSLALQPGNVESSGGPKPAAPSPKPSSSPPFPFNAVTPDGGGMSLLVTLVTALAVLVGVVALARLTVGEDLFSTRWLH